MNKTKKAVKSFRSKAKENGMKKKTINKIVESILEASIELELHPDECFGVFLALEQMIERDVQQKDI